MSVVDFLRVEAEGKEEGGDSTATPYLASILSAASEVAVKLIFLEVWGIAVGAARFIGTKVFNFWIRRKLVDSRPIDLDLCCQFLDLVDI